jgi:hypothetical protein
LGLQGGWDSLQISLDLLIRESGEKREIEKRLALANVSTALILAKENKRASK